MSVSEIGEEGLLNAYRAIEKKRSRWSICSSVSKGVISLGCLGVSTVAQSFFSTTRFVSALSPVAIGISAFSFVNAACPSRYKKGVDQIGLEAIRLGIPLYFLLTQLYLGAQGNKDKEAYLAIMMTLYGVQIAALVRKFATFHFKSSENRELLAKNENKKTFTVLGGSTPLAKNVKYASMAALGASVYGVSYLLTNLEDKEAIQSLGLFFVGEALSIPLWNRVEIWMDRLEINYEAQLQTTEEVKISKKLKSIRMLQRILRFVLPLSISGLFFEPDPYKMGCVGIIHGVLDEMNRYPFCTKEISKIDSIRKRTLTRNCLYVDTSRKVILYLAQVGGVTYFSYWVFSYDVPVYNLAIGSFLGGLMTGFSLTTLGDHLFHEEHSSNLVTTLFFRTMVSPEMLPLYIYLYSVRSHIHIGSEALNQLTLKTGIFQFIIWAAYGFSIGQEIAQFDSDRKIKPIRIPHWLLLSNTLTFLDLLKTSAKADGSQN